ncbi:MAG: tetratricopeptide repeat protein [Novosphingobium sp.]|nr:MAG: tetratricopeptide repeat protein [Novosphingobium sp.]
MRKTGCLAAIVLLTTAATTHAEPMTPEAAREAVSKAMDEIRKQNPTAVLPLVEPVVVSLQDQRKDRNALCADDPTQSLTLMLMQAAVSDQFPNEQQREAVEIDGAFCLAPFLKGCALIDLHRWDDAEPMLRLASESAPLNAQFRNEYAEWFKAMKQWQKAHDVFEEAYGLGEYAGDEANKKANQARALRGMGFTEIEMGDLDKAEESFRKSLKIIPDHEGAKSELQYIANLRKKAKN